MLLGADVGVLRYVLAQNGLEQTGYERISFCFIESAQSGQRVGFIVFDCPAGYRAYKSVLEATEGVAWNDVQPPSDRAFGVNFKGVPLIVRFKEELTEGTFKRWMDLAFKKRGIFRLWGDPVWMGKTKVHVYGADRHLWQPINLEFTNKGIVAILPSGTCGNTFHRLVTNIQRFVCPKIDAWLGAKPFSALTDAVSNSMEDNGEK